MIPPARWILAADLGGSKTLVALATVDGKIERTEESGPGNPVRVGPVVAMDSLRSGLRRVLEALPEPPVIAAACIGMAGRSHPGAAGVAQAAFLQLPTPERRVLLDDTAIAFAQAFHDGPGVLVLSGTGSGAVARGDHGTRRLGGFGPILGDEGSAHAIGLAAVRAIARAEDGRLPKTALKDRVVGTLEHPELRMLPFLASQGRVDYPKIFRIVDDLAREGDPVALAILKDAGKDLAELGIAAARAAGVAKDCVVATVGGAVGHSLILRDALFAHLAVAGGGLRPGKHVDQPVLGAVHLAVESLATPAASFKQDW